MPKPGHDLRPRRSGPATSRCPVQELLDALEAPACVLDAGGRILAVNAAWRAFGAANGGGETALRTDYLAVCEAGSATAVAAGLRDLLTGRTDRFDHCYPCHGRGRERWFDLRATRYPGRGGACALLQHHDVTEQVVSQRALRLTSDMLDQVNAAVIATDLDGRVVSWSQGATSMYGWSAEEALGRDLAHLTVAPELIDAREEVMTALADHGSWEGEFDMVRRDGSTFIGTTRSAVYHDEHGTPAGLVGVSLDVTERVANEQHLRAARDYLRAVTDSMGEGLITIDADGRLTYLNTAAERMLGWSAAEVIGRPMHATMHHTRADGSPFPAEECPLVGPRNGGPAVRDSHDGFYRKDGSRLPVAWVSSPLRTSAGGAVVVFSDITEQLAEQRTMQLQIEELSMLDEIRRALDEDRFVLHGQPIVDLATGATSHQELLIRMVSPEGELVPPGRFLPVAEKHGAVCDIDRWVIRRAAEIAAGGTRVAINLSAASLEDPDLPGVLAEALTATGARACDILIELTETALMRNPARAGAVVAAASGLGYEIALDDFGTGYGGFSYLKQLDIHYLKIDIEFVCDIATNPASRHVVEAVVGLARSFVLRTIAEGVEDPGTLGLLRDIGVDYVQGFGLGRPAPIAGASVDEA